MKRLTKLAAGLALAGVCTLAHADPVSVAALFANAALAATATTLTVGQLIAATIAVTALNAAASSRAQRAAANRARLAYNASLQDKQLTIRSAIMPRPVIYGRAMVGGAVVFAHTSGARSEFLHLVVAIAGHQCDAIEEIWFGDTLLPVPDVNGDIQSGPFVRTDRIGEVASYSTTSFTLPQTPTPGSVVITRVRGEGETQTTTLLTLGVDYTLTGAAVAITTGHLAGDTYTANWDWTRLSPRVRIRTYLGAPGQVADPALIAAAPGRWTSAHVGNGITYAYIRLEYDQDVFGQVGVPEMRFVVRGKRCRDPRDGVVRWTQNAAICTADYLQDPVHGLSATAAEVPDAEVIAAANVCDEEVTLYSTGTVSVVAGGNIVTGTGTEWLRRVRRGMLFRGPDGITRGEVLSVASDTSLALTQPYSGATASGTYSIRQRRYTVNDALGTEASPRDNLEALVTAMAGAAVWVQGRWLVRAGAARTLEPAITVDSLADGEIAILPRAPRASLFNTVTGTFLDRSVRYAEAQWPEVTSSLYRTQDGGARIARDLALPFTDDATAAQRLGKIELERHRQALTVTLRTNLRAYDLVPTDWVPLTVARYGWSAKVFEVLSRRHAPGGWIEYTLRETSAAVYDWAQGDQTLIDLAPNTLLPDPFAAPATLAGVTVASGTAHLLRQADGTVITRGLVQWTASSDQFVRSGGRIEIEYKRDDETTWTAAPPEPGDATAAYIGPLEDRRITLVRVRPVNSLGRVGSWATVVHAVIGKTAAPSDVAGLTAAAIQGAIRISWTPPVDADYGTTELRRGASWAAGVRLDTGGTGSLEAPGSSYDWLWPTPGSYTILARHRDSSGNLSTATTSLALTVTAAGIGIAGTTLIGGTDAAALVSTANTAATNASNALSQLTLITSDNVLSQPEKPAVLTEHAAVTGEHAGILALADARAITTERTAYVNAYNALISYLATLTTPTLWSDTSGTTNIVGATFRANWSTLYTARQALLNRIAASAVGGINLLANSSFEADTDANGLADSWLAYSNGTTGTITRSIVAGAGRRGSRSQRVAATALGTTDLDRVGVYQVLSASDLAGRPVVLSGWIRDVASSAARGRMSIIARNSGGTILASQASAVTTLAGTYTQLVTRLDLPGGTTSVEAYIWVQQQAVASAAFCEFDDVQLQVGEVPTEWVPRADEILPGVVGTVELAENAATDSDVVTVSTFSHSVTGGPGGVFGKAVVARAVYVNSTARSVDVEFTAESGMRSTSSGGSVVPTFYVGTSSTPDTANIADTQPGWQVVGETLQRFAWVRNITLSPGQTAYAEVWMVIPAINATRTAQALDTTVRLAGIKA